MRIVAASLAFATILYAPLALAQGTAQQRSDCMGDAFKFCSADIPFVSKIEACLESNMGQLSPACRSEFAPAKKTKLRTEHFR
jgi:hypothetical protein